MLGARALQWSQKTFLRSPLGPHERPQSETRRKPTPSTGKVFQKNLSKTKVFQKNRRKKRENDKTLFEGRLSTFSKMAWGFHFFKKSGACGAAGAAGACGFRILNLKHKNQNTWKRLVFSDILFFFFFPFFFRSWGKRLSASVLKLRSLLEETETPKTFSFPFGSVEPAFASRALFDWLLALLSDVSHVFAQIFRSGMVTFSVCHTRIRFCYSRIPACLARPGTSTVHPRFYRPSPDDQRHCNDIAHGVGLRNLEE